MVSTSFMMLLLFAATLAFAAPTNNNGHLAISGSSDAWASLVANVAPLLILIGEKNVKSYFKCLSQPSQVYLYAASPIGLITAIVTSIRLGSSPLMKRLIGRQFESRAEVLADVTSISGGNVGFELKGPRNILEQTIKPTEDDEARFWIQGRTTGTGDEGLRFRAAVEAVVADTASTAGVRASGKPSACEIPENEPLYTTRFIKRIASRVFGSPKSLPSPDRGQADATSERTQQRKNRHLDAGVWLPWWVEKETPFGPRSCESKIVVVFDAAGPHARDTTHWYAIQRARYKMNRSKGSQDVSVDVNQAKDNSSLLCSSRGLTYLTWPDVSHALTTNLNVMVPLLYVSRLMVIAMCLSINGILVVLNWRVGHNLMTTVFVSLGLLGSYSFSVWTATLVGRSTRQEIVSVKDIHPFRAGYWSTNFPWGVQLAYCPRRVVMSMERNLRSQHFEEGPLWYTPLFVSLTVISFLLLYLGLRAAEWWLSFAIFGNVGFATCMRAILTIHSPLHGSTWDRSSGPCWTPDPLTGEDPLWLLHLREDLQMGTKHPLSSIEKKYRASNIECAAGTRSDGQHRLFLRLFEWTATFPSKFSQLRRVLKDKPPQHLSRTHTSFAHQHETSNLGVDDTSSERWSVLTISRIAAGEYGDPYRAPCPDAFAPHLNLLLVSLAVATEIFHRNLRPHDFSSQRRWKMKRVGDAPQDSQVHFLRSEFITQGAIWEQPLEIALPYYNTDALAPEKAIDAVLRSWAVQAFLGGHALSKRRSIRQMAQPQIKSSIKDTLILQFSEEVESRENIRVEEFWKLAKRVQTKALRETHESLSLSAKHPHILEEMVAFTCPEPFPEYSAAGLDPPTAVRLGKLIWTPPWMLWMCVKVRLALFCPEEARSATVPRSPFEPTRPAPSDQNLGFENKYGQTWAGDYVDFLEAAGLLKPASKPHPTAEGQATPTSAVVGHEPRSTQHSSGPDCQRDDTSDVGYMSFG
ncbi:hypothetical protein MMC16_001605 [Acarospora aff. strigata]|nr:hypothetical protein [Acarospora aff. strigata]